MRHLPGDLQQKVDPYLRPLYDALYEIMGAENFSPNVLGFKCLPFAVTQIKSSYTFSSSFKSASSAEARKFQKTRTPEEAKALLEENLRKKTENLLSAYGTIEDIEIHYTEYADSIHAEAEASPPA